MFSPYNEESMSTPSLRVHQMSDEAEVTSAVPTGEESVEDRRKRLEFAYLKDLALSRVRQAMGSTSMLTERDYKEYQNECFDEAKLEMVGLRTYDEKIRAVRENLDTLIPRVESEAQTIEASFRTKVAHAEEQKWISGRSAKEWVSRLENSNVPQWKKKAFLQETFFPDYWENWRQLGHDTEMVRKDVRALQMGNRDIPELATIFTSDLEDIRPEFIDRNYHYKRDVVSRAMSVVTAAKKAGRPGAEDMQELRQLALDQLEDAVAKGALASWKVGEWLRRIFESGTKPENIRKFLTSQGPTPLSILIRNWTNVRSDFDWIESERGKKGRIHRNFHFVHEDIFLNWHFEKRKAYVQEAMNRLKNPDETPDPFLRIRHELDAGDWLAAEERIAEAERMTWAMDEQAELASMKKYLREHRNPSPPEADPSADAWQVWRCMQDALGDIPYDSVRERYCIALEQYDYDTLWALCTMYYNWDWCRQRGYSDDAIDLQSAQQAKRNTYVHMKQGQPRDFAINDYSGDTSKSPAARWDDDTDSPQTIHIDERTDNEGLLHNIHLNRHNRAVWYYASLKEKNIPFEKIQFNIYNVHPRLKWGARRLRDMGLRFTGKGPRNITGTSVYQQAMHPPPN
ncbi:MAG: hypothetical protein Greene041619_961 [Candidatus Peregrinibacteria bacterium Greene0416_19]|nr:MAG: hypothetical protein Greene041619_961 [Candidatus Peregrinibacteria bacterium Greene0416_19]